MMFSFGCDHTFPDLRRTFHQPPAQSRVSCGLFKLVVAQSKEFWERSEIVNGQHSLLEDDSVTFLVTSPWPRLRMQKIRSPLWLRLAAAPRRARRGSELLAEVAWEFSENSFAADECCSGSRLRVVLRKMFTLSFYSDKLKTTKPKPQCSEHPECLSFACRHLPWVLLARMCLWSILGLTGCCQSGPAEAEIRFRGALVGDSGQRIPEQLSNGISWFVYFFLFFHSWMMDQINQILFFLFIYQWRSRTTQLFFYLFPTNVY